MGKRTARTARPTGVTARPTVVKNTRRSRVVSQSSEDSHSTTAELPLPKRSHRSRTAPRPLTTDDIPVVVAAIREPSGNALALESTSRTEVATTTTMATPASGITATAASIALTTTTAASTTVTSTAASNPPPWKTESLGDGGKLNTYVLHSHIWLTCWLIH